MARLQPRYEPAIIIHGNQKLPTVDLTTCSRCGGCIEVAADIFRFSESGGYIEICDLDFYDEILVDEAIKFCPENSINWEEL